MSVAEVSQAQRADLSEGMYRLLVVRCIVISAGTTKGRVRPPLSIKCGI